jgi:hypothetical protein
MRVCQTKTNFNGGELSRRLHARTDLSLYAIGCAELLGWVPLVEGGIEACPGLIHVAQAAGACRLIPFEFNVTQGYIVELSDGVARFYTNDARIEDGDGDPIEVAMPYDVADLAALAWEQSFDGLYLFHRGYQSRQLVRTGADSFELDTLEFENGPFEARNKDETILVTADAVTGSITLTASQGGSPYALFEAGDVGGLFQLEADDFGTIPAWEPGLTVNLGDLRVWGDRVYRNVGGSGRTGTLAPVHAKGVEWDGSGVGSDVNDTPAGGVQWEFLCDRLGVVKITGFTDSDTVTGTVLRRLPFTAASSTSYTVPEGYYDGGWATWEVPPDSVTYNYGTWRWRFGAFSDRRGWPSNGVIWNERLVLAKDSTLYASTEGDLNDFSTYNELGELTNDMALIRTVKDANGILGLIADEKLLILTAGGMFAMGAANAAQGVGPLNARVDRQSNEGAARAMPVEIDGRFVYIGNSSARVIEASYAAERNRQDPVDLTRYARHIGASGFTALAAQKDPNRLIWACRGDGSLACAVYNPDEQALGWARRALGGGLLARSIAGIADPTGRFGQLWVAAQSGDDWHVLRLDGFREESDDTVPAMVDMAVQYADDPATHFGPVAFFANRTVHVNADGAARVVACDGDGAFDLEVPASIVTAGFPFDCRFASLPADKGQMPQDAMVRMSRISIDMLEAQGLSISAQGMEAIPMELLTGASVTEAGFAPFTGKAIVEDSGTDDRYGVFTIERTLPLPATVRAAHVTLDLRER